MFIVGENFGHHLSNFPNFPNFLQRIVGHHFPNFPNILQRIVWVPICCSKCWESWENDAQRFFAECWGSWKTWKKQSEARLEPC